MYSKITSASSAPRRSVEASAVEASGHTLYLLLFGLLLSLSFPAQAQAQRIIDHVNPFIGTGVVESGLSGNNYPGATSPFGMVQLSPDTRSAPDWAEASGYNYNDTTIYGFSHTHLSGTGVADLFDVLLMPVAGNIHDLQNRNEFPSAFSHHSEKARPGYYQVRLSDSDIDVALTATVRAGFHHYTFPAGTEANIVLDLDHSRAKGSWGTRVFLSQIRVVDEYTIEGYRLIGGWANVRKVCFHAKLSQPIVRHVLKSGSEVYENTPVVNGSDLRAILQLSPSGQEAENREILLKIGLSPVSIENARLNLETEIPGWDFNTTLAQTQHEWEKELSKIKVEGSDRQKEIFYTALYHVLIQPNTLSDVNGQYMAADFTVRHTSTPPAYYSTFSLWDTYRAAHPLYTLLQPERNAGFVKSLIAHYESYGYLPIWQLWGQENYCMIGNHSIPVIVDAALKELPGIDPRQAYEAVRQSSLIPHPNSPFEVWEKYGYMPENIQTQSVSITLEMAFDDWCVAQLAQKLGETDDYNRFIARSAYYRNLYNPQTHFFQPKDDTGRWIEPFDPFKYGANGGNPFTEGNAWQYYWYVPHNIENLIELTGGKKAFSQKLDEFFTSDYHVELNDNASGFIGQYAHGNEPSHHVAYLYNYVGEPEKTQYYVSKILNELYNTSTSGYAGNDDCGEMSVWYVFSAMGFYPVNPAGQQYDFGSPLLERAEIALPNGKTFVVSAPKKSPDHIYIHSIKLNGKPYRQNHITHREILQGGTLEFQMTDTPPAQPPRLSDLVNPFIGASTNTAHSYHGLGKTFPGAATPFGMTQVSPNTITGGDNGSGYSYEHTSIEGFAFTQMSGVGWYGDCGNLLVMPSTGALKTLAGHPEDTQSGYRSLYDKASETAQAGYYSALLTDYHIKAEATAAPHSGILRFTFPRHKQSRIQIDLARRVGGTSVYQYIQVKDNRTIRGWMRCTPEGGGWGNGDGHPDYTVYFYAQFSRPLENCGYWSADIPDSLPRRLGDVSSEAYQRRIANAQIIQGMTELEGKHLGFFTEFETEADEVVTLKAAISYVDMEGAEKNFNAEVANRSFDDVCEETKQSWDNALHKITVTGGSREQQTIFYTALYHTLIDPRICSDVDGRYWGGDRQVHHANRFRKRTVFSGWDVFRSQFPLQTIINPELVNDQINSFITLAEENGTGYYDRWEFLNAYSGCMIGNPALSVIADACMKGIRDYDLEKAYRYALRTSEKFGNGTLGYAFPYSISSTLEYAYSDWCMSVLAEALGKEADVARFTRRSQAYRNVFDKEKGWFRPKKQDGSWEEWPENARMQEWYGCIESNSYQQGWFVPHDIPGMVELMGGEEKTRADLLHFFEKAPADLLWNAYYNHANEPVHHVPFLFNRLHAPRLTQQWTRHICEKAYKNTVEGLVGNEDVGQMSAWYVLAAAGIHPLCPGDTRYEITSPVFDAIHFHLDSGKTFTIEAVNNSPENIYIQSMELNGQPLEEYAIDHREIVKGGRLVLKMGR